MCTLISSDGSGPRSELYLNIAMICSLQAFTIRERRMEGGGSDELDWTLLHPQQLFTLGVRVTRKVRIE
jgi:hypothetical protein